jgi:Phage protein Gp19/Gp15/Gp42
MIKRRIKDLDAQVTAATIDVEDLKQVEAEVVLRLVRNPDGYSTESDGT